MITQACIAAVLAFFGQMNVHLNTLPSLVITDEIPYAGLYLGTVLRLRPDADCAVFAHEMYHHKQYEDRGGDATSHAERVYRENIAHKWDIMFRGQDR